MSEAACRGMGPGLFFPENMEHGGRGYSRGDSERVEAAKKVCAGCPVRRDCYEYADRNGEKEGLWGGLSFDSSARARRRRAAFVFG